MASPQVLANLTHFEACVLGLLARDGPQTGYQLREVLAASATPKWRASTGALYPLLRRMKKNGLVDQDDREKSKRSAGPYRLTLLGKRAMIAWLKSGADDALTAVPDPVRTRMYFLSILPVQQQSRVVMDALEGVSTAIEEVERERDLQPEGSVDMDQILLNGILKTLEARKTMLTDLLAHIKTNLPAKTN